MWNTALSFGRKQVGRVVACVCAGLAVLGGVASDARAQAPIGPDVTYQNFTSTFNYGLVGTTRAYMFSSDTCNIGTANLHWGGSWQGSPALGCNLYRINDGRMTQIGMSWLKQACCAAAAGGCGTCNGVGGSQLGIGCRDSYGASYNGGQTRLGPRSQVNAWTGAMLLAPTNTGNAIFKRLQVADSDVDINLWPGARWIGEGVYAANDDAPAMQHFNNASWKHVTVDAARNLGAANAMHIGEPAIYAWRLMGGPGGTLDPNVNISIVPIPNEGRLYLATKVTPLGNCTWRYDYAIYNLNSDRSVGTLSIPAASDVTVTEIGFKDVDYHSGEPYDNTNWSGVKMTSTVEFASPQTYAQNPNSNALRWGTMYNYWFTTNSPPTNGALTIGLFKPHTPQAVTAPALVPSPRCTADFDRDSDTGTDADIESFLTCLGGNCCTNCGCPDFDGDGDTGTDDDIGAFFRVLGGGSC